MLQVSAGIIVSNHKILCMQKGKAKYDYLTGKYEFPGGKIEGNESPKDTLIRELKEEMDADISLAKIELFNECEYAYPDFSVHLYNFIVYVDNFNFTLKEHLSFKWVRPKDLQTLDWAAADDQIIKELQRYFDE